MEHDDKLLLGVLTVIPMVTGAAKRKSQQLPMQCRECKFLFACHGECPKNRFLRDSYGETGLNYLCQGYRRFFQHVGADMAYMRAEWLTGRPPSNIMQMF